MITSVSVPQTALKSANISFIPGSSGNTPIERFIFQKRMVTFYPEKGENKQKQCIKKKWIIVFYLTFNNISDMLWRSIFF